VRVIEVAPRERRVRLRVFVVYYDTGGEHKYHQPLPDDASFFFRYLCETSDRRFDQGGPLGDVVTVDDWLDEPYVDEHAWRYVEKVQRVATRNFPVEDWSRYHDFYYERGGRWQDEDQLVQADYDVWVTDARWIEQLTLGQSAGTTCYATRADRMRADDAAHVPDLRRPAITIVPFPDQPTESGTPGQLAYSDDNRFLAVTSDAGEVVIYDVAAGYREHARTKTSVTSFCELGWVPGTHIVVQSHLDEARAAVDADTGAPVAPPVTRTGRVWSKNHRVLEYGADDTLVLDDHPPLDLGFCIESVAFAHDESRLYAAGMGTSVFAIDPSSAKVVRTFENVTDRVRSLATNRDGSYVVFSECYRSNVGLLRAADGEVLALIPVPNAPHATQLAWSPDGTQVALLVVTGDLGYGGELRVFPVGLPATAKREAPAPPAAEQATSTIHPELVLQLARASAAFTAAEWAALVEAHTRWLDTGGGGGDGGLPDSYFYESPWKTLEAGGMILALWTGENGSDGTQAVLRMRRLDGFPAAARLAWADLSGVLGEHADFARADLRGVTATDAHLPHASFRGADLRMADFSRANLAHADFTNANLEGCDFERADLTGAIFTGARIGGIKLANTRLDEIRDFGV
jgi:hypothetical protein